MMGAIPMQKEGLAENGQEVMSDKEVYDNHRDLP
jgi:hypothetical protein